MLWWIRVLDLGGLLMAQVLDVLPSQKRRSAKYPYDEWLDGRAWGLVGGVDFTCSPASLRASLAEAARGRNLRLRTRTTEDGLAVQAVPPKD